MAPVGRCDFMDLGHHMPLSLALLIVDPQKYKERETKGKKTGFITRWIKAIYSNMNYWKGLVFKDIQGEMTPGSNSSVFFCTFSNHVTCVKIAIPKSCNTVELIV